MLKKTKKLLSMGLVAAMVGSIAVSGTMAYLTSEDSDVNVMTVGGVEIKQIELQRNVDETGEKISHNATAKEGDLVAFKQGQNLYPAYPKDGPSDYTAKATDLFHWGPYVTADNDENQAGNGLWPDTLNGAMDKFVFVKNTGNSDCYFRTWLAFECPEGMEYGAGSDKEFMMNINSGYTLSGFDDENDYVEIDGVRYLVGCLTYTWEDGILPAGEIARPSLLQVVMTEHATSDDMKLIGDTYEILVYSQACQTTNFPNAETALFASFGSEHPWKNGVSIPVAVDNAKELEEAIEAGKSVYLTEDITGLSANEAIEVASGADVEIDLGGHTIAATANDTGNQELFLVKGDLTVQNGTMNLKAENNQNWNAMATIFDVTAGGVLNLDHVTAAVSGTDMNFIVHLNNWGEATLNVDDCDFKATYCAVRAFNSGYDMNNVTIKNTDFKTGRAFWVHNYTSEGKDDSTLNLDIYNNGNTSDHEKPVRFGFDESTYFDLNGNAIE